MSEPQGRTPCAQCVGSQCGGSTCQFDCEYGTGWCQTWVAGGGFATGCFQKEDVKFKVAPIGIIGDASQEMIDQGIVDGTLISHVGNHSPRNIADWGKLLEILPVGISLRVKKPGEKWEWVTLK